MESTMLSAKQAAQRLGISVTTLYDWFGKSDHGLLEIQGQKVTIEYFQSGRRGQGKIQIETLELERIKAAMRVRPRTRHKRASPSYNKHFPGITVALGRPDQSD